MALDVNAGAFVGFAATPLGAYPPRKVQIIRPPGNYFKLFTEYKSTNQTARTAFVYSKFNIRQ